MNWLSWLLTAMLGFSAYSAITTGSQSTAMIALPSPRLESRYSVEQALRERRCLREFSQAPLTLAEVSQLLWAAQGVTSAEGMRTAPSAGALYPLEVYLVVSNVQGLEAGVYQYKPAEHGLVRWIPGNKYPDLIAAALGQSWMQQSALIIALAAVAERITWKYGERGLRYIDMEVGHAAQNVLLQAVALGLGAAVVGAFDDRRVAQVLSLPKQEAALYLIPIGKR
jgi:SagB-type dehydrogenase family enzyme